MKTQTPDYHAFLVRVWRENGRSPWRAAIENPHTGEKQTFPSPEQFWTYMQTQIEHTAIVLEQGSVPTTELEQI